MLPIDGELTDQNLGYTDFSTVMAYAAVGLWRYHNSLAGGTEMTAALGESDKKRMMWTARGFTDTKETSWMHGYMVGDTEVGNQDVVGASHHRASSTWRWAWWLAWNGTAQCPRPMIRSLGTLQSRRWN